jgi:hypothetical protein
LSLNGPQWSVLCRTAGLPEPSGFGPTRAVSEDELASARAALTEQGVLDDAGEAGLHPSLSANLAIWAMPAVIVRVDVWMRDRGLRAAYAVQGQLGASLFTLADDGVELSLFAAADLGFELRRCVPDLPADTVGRSTMSRLVPGTGSARVHGRLPLAVLTDGAVPGDEVRGRTVGVLQCLAVGGPPGDTGSAVAGNVVWVATDAGWVGVSPHPDGTGRRLVDLVPVQPEAIGGWLAPHLARILEVTNA